MFTACPGMSDAIMAAHDEVAKALFKAITNSLGCAAVLLESPTMDSITRHTFNDVPGGGREAQGGEVQCPVEIARHTVTPDAVLGYRRKGASTGVLLEFTRCFTETVEGLLVRDAAKAAKDHKYQGAALYLRKLYPTAAVQHITVLLSVFGTMLEDDSRLRETGRPWLVTGGAAEGST
eukprot:2677627-Rhodomonas_salina.4